MKKTTFLFIICFTSIIAAQNIQIELVANGFEAPVSIKNANDSKLFIVERKGVIKILNANGSVNSTAFLDIDSKVSDSGGERGLLGLAFHPNYSSNGFFYVNYVNNSGNTVIARYSRTNETTADVNSELILLTINQPASNHNGGDMNFGSDGYLYIASGDGGGAGDPSNYAQSLNTLLGKLLRIDVDNTSNGNNYAIPSNNPYLNDGDTNTLPEIWAYGLRNPWKFSFDKTTSDIWIADVGQDNYEEINKINTANGAGNNFGWRCFEGNNHIFNSTGNCSTIDFNNTVAPVAEYPHVGTGCSGSITGGYLYRGSLYSSFIGKYFFADYCKQTIGILTDTGSGWSLSFQTPNITAGWTTFGEDVNGEIYIAGGSSIYKIVDANLSVKDDTISNIKIYPNPTNNILNFNVSQISNPLAYIKVIDIQGKQIKSITSISSPVTTISINNLANGMYFIELSDISGVKAIKKLIKY
ncbi:PQQ-dependent sugar dehydrogenase [Mariniflexile gromovii]|uniref:PQQ-dependent sugar dehydrogenase n=1 Tax=Mariniflexile gromovii TaxID=362523 RepID=A0ABS4BX70_9FLAO|nr:PQQ-dependent sugar dehydrogenase [Mariniflexile gromovii]MBP0905194.1 PQQ-dependent sugar dehydrogenase [Mariniflexile gromovii]